MNKNKEGRFLKRKPPRHSAGHRSSYRSNPKEAPVGWLEIRRDRSLAEESIMQIAKQEDLRKIQNR